MIYPAVLDEMAFVLTNDSVTIQAPHPTGDRQLRLQGQLAPRLVDTDGQGQVAKARERDVPQEGEVPGDRTRIDTEQSRSFWLSRHFEILGARAG